MQVYPTWGDVFKSERSSFFSAHASDCLEESPHLSPSQKLMFIQSNARIVLGQSPTGNLSWVAAPSRIYPAPVGLIEPGGIQFYPGMYHQTDILTYLGPLAYKVKIMEDNKVSNLQPGAGDSTNETYYANHFLPVTEFQSGDLSMAIMSFAPVLTEAEGAPLAPAPLPGPSGAQYVLYLRNSGSTAVRAAIRLEAGDVFTDSYPDNHFTTEPQFFEPSQSKIRQETLIFTKPEGAFGIHMEYGKWSQEAENWVSLREVELAPGQEITIVTHVAVNAEYQEIMPTIFNLALHPALDWLNATAAFWRSRLGHSEINAFDYSLEAKKSWDIYIRSSIDNFNCIQTDSSGNLLTLWQGAPSHNPGTLWGIDVEPTVASVMPLVPELGKQVLLFFMENSRAPLSPFSPIEHSVPILVGPLIIARRYLELTGDHKLFADKESRVMDNLERIYRDLLTMKHEIYTLFKTRFSSDGRVMRKYDFGTNVKVGYALECYGYILEHLGQTLESKVCVAMAEQLRQDIKETMIIEGPLGAQFSGGTNLGEPTEDFYWEEHIPYYDGEDTSSCLAPLYGACDFTDEAWRNYHLFAFSLWGENFDAEFNSVRWTPGASPLCGTGFVSRWAKSVSRREMADALNNLYSKCDETGSFYWWPYAPDRIRSVTRCSQGQGAYAWHYLQYWLGLHIDVLTRTMIVHPQGLISNFQWKGIQIGSCRFDVQWNETPQGATAIIVNLNDEEWTVRVCARDYLSGAGAGITSQELLIRSGQSAHYAVTTNKHITDGLTEMHLPRKEAEVFGDKDGIVFHYFGSAPLRNGIFGFWRQADILYLIQQRFVIVNGTDSDWTECRVTFSIPNEGWGVQAKPAQHWLWEENNFGREAACIIGNVPSGERAIASFWVNPPAEKEIEKITYSKHPFDRYRNPNVEAAILVEYKGKQPQSSFVSQAQLTARKCDGTIIDKELLLPVGISFTNNQTIVTNGMSN